MGRNFIFEGESPKIKRLVDLINTTIAKAVDSDGDPIAVIDPSST